MKPPTKSPFQLLIVFALLMLYYSPPLVLGQLVINGYTIEPGANLMAADLSDANLSASDLSGSSLSGSNLRFANLTDATLTRSDLIGANLIGANLTNVNLTAANLGNADLSAADLNSANLNSADLTRADLFAANLRFADLSNANLTEATLTGANLTNAFYDHNTQFSAGFDPSNAAMLLIEPNSDLRDTDLNDANLSNVNLTDADLSNTNLTDANLSDADLINATLTDSDLTDSDLTGANLTDSDLTGANLTDANLTDANLSGADLRFANLTNATLTRADLSNAGLTGADLSGYDLTNVNLSGAILTSSDLTRADLSNADLRDATLTRADLSNADLRDADLFAANLSNANLTDTTLTRTDLSNADLRDATLTRANLSNADLRFANLTDTTLTDANLSDANLINADLTGADLSGYDLTNVNLSGAILTSSDLSGTNLSGANLSGANLTGSDLKDADLTRSDLRFADLSGSNLSNANLSDATLSRANLSDTNLSDANLSDALYDQNTQFPTDFDPSTTAMLLVTSATQTAGSSSINLIQGINMIVLPFQTETAYTAKTLAQHLAGNNDNLNDDSTVDVTWVIRYHLINQKFEAYVWSLDQADPGFEIQGGQDYIVHVSSDRSVTFERGLCSGVLKPMSAPNSVIASNIWAFVVSGNLTNKIVSSDEDYRLQAINLTTGKRLAEIESRGHSFRLPLVNLNRQDLVVEGDLVEVKLIGNNGKRRANSQFRVGQQELATAYRLVELESNPVPDLTRLLQNYPNPFNPETWIPYQLSQDSEVKIRIYDVGGLLVRSMEVGFQEAGTYSSREKAIYWDGKNQHGEQISSGVYFYSLELGEESQTRRMVILK